MEKMTKAEMIDFLKGMNKRAKLLEEEKRRIRGSVETLEEAIERNNFARHGDETGISTPGFSPDKVLRALLNSQRDIEEETRNMVYQMRDIYEKEDQINFVRRCLLQMETKEQDLIREVYINDTVIDKLVPKMNISRSQLYRYLQRAMDNLLHIYNASCHEFVSIRAKRLISEVVPFMPEGSIA